ncbi:unnamed protein product [Callosobruchus maculatus]|uniref:Uncharacterized protein n=1 Tax=Callosobruchus maculatus TaxID=64391 RepID=A0A653D9F3_CALMS|nr:unnamed protein product [Callosobruchus maculatus]
MLKACYALHETVLCLKLGTLCMCLLCLKASYALHETFMLKAWYALHVFIVFES